MVTLHIIVEGGGPTKDPADQTFSNTESLRQSFHQFFSRLLGREDISIVVHIGYANRNAVKQFIADDSLNYLFVDSDHPAKEMHKWFDSLNNPGNPEKSIVIPVLREKQIYFMIQEMEGWFLKQPNCIDAWAAMDGYTRRHDHIHDEISDYAPLKGKNVEDITKPSSLIATIVKVYFEKRTNGKRKLGKYGKLKTAPAMIDALNTTRLLTQDQELQRFKKAAINHSME